MALCLLGMAGLWNLTSLGRGYAVLGPVTARAQSAYRELASAQAALGAKDFGASEDHFHSAQELLTGARAELNGALSSSAAVARYGDVTGTVRSGDQLLAAGESIAVAGAHLAAGMKVLTQAQVLPTESVAPALPLVAALEEALVSLAKAQAALVDVERSLEQVQLVTLPHDIKEQVAVMQKAVPAARSMLGSFLDQSQVLLSILGVNEQRDYLIVFQNNHEIRPTGGFIGSLALLNVNRGMVEDINVQTVYDGDGQLKEFIAPPAPLLAITDRWYLRDANWFVNYPTSAAKIMSFFEKEGGPTVDGVIALTPEVIKELLTITGPIALPEYDVVVDAESFVPLTQDLVTYSYDREVNRPKQFLADLTPVLLNRIFADKTDLLRVLSVLSDMAQQKQLLVYFRDADEQARITRQGWDGSLPKEAPNFLSVINANIGGHKSDQFMTQEIDYRLSVTEAGQAEALVTIRRTHHGPTEKLDLPYPPDNNPAEKDNVVYQRVFVPPDAELLEASGFTPAADIPQYVPEQALPSVAPDAEVVDWQQQQRPHVSGTTVGEEAGYRYFANWLVTKPGATSIAWYRYRLSEPLSLPHGLNVAERLGLYVGKQAGDTRSELRLELRLPSRWHVVHTVPNDGITQTEEGTIVYRGVLRVDTLLGVVLEKK